MSAPIPIEPTYGDWSPKVNKIIDVSLICVFSLQLLMHSLLNISYLVRKREARSLYNLILSVGISSCLITHIACLMYGTVVMKNNSVPPIGIDCYLFFQLTFDLLNVALIAHIFQWLEIQYTLICVINILDAEEIEESFRSTMRTTEKSKVRSSATAKFLALRSLALKPESLKTSLR